MKILLENIESIQNSKYNFEFNKKITLKERYFFNFLMKEAIKRKKLIIILEEKFFTETLKEDNIDRFLNLLFEKKIIITDNKEKFSRILKSYSEFFKKR